MAFDATLWNRIRYGLYAPFYDLVAGGFGRQRARSISLLDIKPSERALIVGCGTGLDLAYLPKDAHIVATDITPGMVSRTQARAKGLHMVDVRATVMDGHALEFKDGEFDCIILHLIIAVIPDPVRCVREAARVLRPGGRAVVFDKFMHGGQRPSILRRALNVFTRLFFSDINRDIYAILEQAGTGLKVQREEPAAFWGMFRIYLLSNQPPSGST